MKYPKGTRFQAWSLYIEKQKGIYRPVIKRWVTAIRIVIYITYVNLDKIVARNIG